MYAVLTTAELSLIDLDNVKINGELIDCVPRDSVDGTLHIIQGDQFTQYTESEIKQYINNNYSFWNNNNPYYIEYSFSENIINISAIHSYPVFYVTKNINDLSQEHQDIMYILKDRILSEYEDCEVVKFKRDDAIVELYTQSEGIIFKSISNMQEDEYLDYNNVGLICNILSNL
tara:strand:+ start:1123 stop:1644 length:522 start_codon:yes stop_codon:yes gene_type:complete